MKNSFKPQNLKRYKDIARLLLKYGNNDMVHQFGLRATLEETELHTPDEKNPPEQLARDLEKLGPTFVKLGQILSSRPDLLPTPYIEALSRLQDQVEPFSYEEVEAIVTVELGARISKAFAWFEREPLAAASLGQVHRATLRDGRPVVVKVQRPGIRKQIAEDLEAIENLTEFLDKHTKVGRRYQVLKIFEEFQKTLIYELDYQREAANLITIGENLKEFARIIIPQPVADYTTRTVLTMAYVEGKKITAIEPLERMELKGGEIADELFRGYLKQVLVDGIFHADPHPGNVFLTPDHRVCLLDLGMVGRTTPTMQENLIKLLIAISEGQGEQAVDLAIQMSETTAHFKEAEFRRKISAMVAEQQDQTLHKIDIGHALLELGRGAGENGLFVPTELTMLGKTLLQLDQIGRALDPEFNPNAAVRRHVTDLLNRRLRKEASAGQLVTSLLELKDFVGGLPNRLNKILDAVGNAELEVKVRATDANDLIDGFQKIANRITTGLILAALIVGASLLMQVETAFQIFGYPGLAIMLFLAAAGGGCWLVISIFLKDHRRKQE
jgi:ubiquinone biosynthesis protein